MRAFFLALACVVSGCFGTVVLAQGAPGTLLSSTPMAGAPAGSRAWRIRYLSRTEGGVPEEVTGVVVAPTGPAPAGGRPVLAWAHGTVGVTRQCAPFASARFFTITPGLRDALARGFVVAATDYRGLGTPGPHPYLVGPSAAMNVLDSVHAARALNGAGAGIRLALWGESQGGHAALWAAELQRSYAPELRLAGVAAAAPPTDLLANLTGGTDPAVRAYLTSFVAHTWSRYYGIPLSTSGRPATGRLIDRLASNCVSVEGPPRLGTALGVVALRRQLRGVDLARIPAWAQPARANSPGQRRLAVPLLLAQNRGDAIVSPAVTRSFARRACANGTRVRWIELSGKGGHITSGADSGAATLDWFADRLAGRPAPDDCRQLQAQAMGSTRRALPLSGRP